VSFAPRSIRIAPDLDLPLLASTCIPSSFVHGFTTRRGGVSRAPFASLNLGWKWGDDEASVLENHRRVCAAAGVTAMARVSQVHGTQVLRIGRADELRRLSAMEGDGLCTDEPGVALSVHVADCTPILMACPRTGACASLHAGWRGTVAGMARAGVETLRREFGCEPEHVRVALGPCIGRCCFEVGPEVVNAFVQAMPDAVARGVVDVMVGAKPHIDLRRFQRLQLQAAGIPPENIDASTACTLCDAEGRFYSFRRDGRATGQSIGFIVRV
jgi:YfiH family protein